jgi:large subunit ribosomal protein L17
MRHGNLGRKFDRDSSSRKAMFKNLVANLFAHGRIETTVPKAKEVRRLAERIITKATRLGAEMNSESLAGEAASRRLAVKRHLSRWLPRYSERLVDGEPERLDVVEHLFREVAPRFVGRPGGYTRIVKTRNRRGDNAEMALLALVGFTPPTKATADDKPTSAKA